MSVTTEINKTIAFARDNLAGGAVLALLEAASAAAGADESAAHVARAVETERQANAMAKQKFSKKADQAGATEKERTARELAEAAAAQASENLRAKHAVAGHAVGERVARK